MTDSLATLAKLDCWTVFSLVHLDQSIKRTYLEVFPVPSSSSWTRPVWFLLTHALQSRLAAYTKQSSLLWLLDNQSFNPYSLLLLWWWILWLFIPDCPLNWNGPNQCCKFFLKVDPWCDPNHHIEIVLALYRRLTVQQLQQIW